MNAQQFRDTLAAVLLGNAIFYVVTKYLLH